MPPFVIKGPKRSFPIITPLLLLVALLAFWHAGCPEPPHHLHPSTDPVRTALTEVIAAQLAAFREDDFERAYTFAAEPIQRQFAPAQFEAMVRQGYPAIAAAESASFGVAFDNGREAVVLVTVISRDRRRASYNYLLVREKRAWKITGVVVSRGPAGVL